MDKGNVVNKNDIFVFNWGYVFGLIIKYFFRVYVGIVREIGFIFW